MAFDDRKNFALSSVSSAPSPASSGTSLTVTTGHGTRFPTPPFNAVICPSTGNPDPTTAEVVRVTNIVGDTFTVTRAQESSSARSVIVGDLIFAALTDKTLQDIEDVLNAASSNPGAAAKLLQSSASGTLQLVGMITGKIYPASDGTTAVQILKADGTTAVLNVDTTNGRLALGSTDTTSVAPATYKLQQDGAATQTMSFLQYSGAGTATNIAFSMYASRGTSASPSAVQANDTFLNFGARGYGATGFAALNRVRVLFAAAENWTDAAQGTYIQLDTTPLGSTTRAVRLTIDAGGNIVVGTAALATNATDGFLYIPSCAGTPTGVPTTYTGRCAMVYDTTNNKLYVYNGAWKGVTLA